MVGLDGFCILVGRGEVQSVNRVLVSTRSSPRRPCMVFIHIGKSQGRTKLQFSTRGGALDCPTGAYPIFVAVFLVGNCSASCVAASVSWHSFSSTEISSVPKVFRSRC